MIAVEAISRNKTRDFGGAHRDDHSSLVMKHTPSDTGIVAVEIAHIYQLVSSLRVALKSNNSTTLSKEQSH